MTPFLAIIAGMAAVMLAAGLTQRMIRNGGWGDVFWTFGTGAAAAMRGRGRTGMERQE